MHSAVNLYVPVLLFFGLAFSVPERKPEPYETVTIDTLSLTGNWITWDRVILNELEFKPGQEVTYGVLDTSIIKVWNIGNFAEVDYEIHKLKDGRNHMVIRALDALMLQPVIAIDYSSKHDYDIGLGIMDRNLIGTNITAKVRAGLNPTGNSWDFKVKLPRQMLYQNMTLQSGFVIGDKIIRHVNRNIVRRASGKSDSVHFQSVMIAPYKKAEIYGTVGNPWHLDYKYAFSPDISWCFRYNRIDTSLVSGEDAGVMVDPYTLRMLVLTLTESMGKVNTRRHRKDGFKLEGSLNLYIGLDGRTEGHKSMELEAEYHKILNRILQFSSWYKTGLTNAGLPALQYVKGSGDVLGHRSGELYGKVFYSAYLGAHFTWLNFKWISLENAYFVNFGNGATRYPSLYRADVKYAIGSSFRLNIPMVPWLYGIFTFVYAGPGADWFKFETAE